MKISSHVLIAIVSGGLLMSCGSSGSSSEAGAAAQGSPQEAFRMKSGEMFDDDSQQILGRYGSRNPALSGGQGKAADEGSKVNSHFNSEYGRKEFNSKSYEKKAFWGRSDYAKQVYQGDGAAKSFDKGAREGGLWASEGAQVSRESGESFD
ncbi:MAG: hypothetical protein ACQKBU_09030, partial [Verrucomicrobiales bacterium]